MRSALYDKNLDSTTGVTDIKKEPQQRITHRLLVGKLSSSLLNYYTLYLA